MTVTPLSIRREQGMKLADFSKGRGLEIGPLNQPLITKDMADVRYVDVFSSSHLRAHYSQDPNVNVDDIPDIDFVLSASDSVRPLPEAVRPGAPFAWVVASHVVEHVPDVIAWLAQIAEVIEDGAVLLLVVPDRRFSFDILRPATTVGQLLQAHELSETRPSVRAVYDHFRSHVSVDASDAWRGIVPTHESRIFDLAGTMSQVRLAQEGHYVDSHVWTFTPASFVEQMAELGQLGISEFVVENIVPTAENQLEFFAVLRRLPRGLPSEDVAAFRASGVLELEDNDPIENRVRAESESLAAEVARLRAELDDHILAMGRQTREFEDELAQIRASERWRLGGLVVVPATKVKRLFVR
jgi:Methyltransferase domain